MSTFILDSTKLNEAISSLQTCSGELTNLRLRVAAENRRLIGQKGFRIQTTNGELSAFLKQIDNQIYNVNLTATMLTSIEILVKDANKQAEKILDEKNVIDSILEVLKQSHQYKNYELLDGIIKGNKGIGDIADVVSILTNLKDDSQLSELLDKLGDNSITSAFKTIGYGKDAFGILEAILKDDTEAMLGYGEKYSIKAMKDIFKTIGYKSFTAESIARYIFNAAEAYGENVSNFHKSPYRGMAWTAETALDMTLGAFVKTGVEMAYDMTNDVLEGADQALNVFGIDVIDSLDDKYENGVDSFYKQFGELVYEMEVYWVGEENVQLLNESLSFGNAVSELGEAFKRIIKG